MFQLGDQNVFKHSNKCISGFQVTWYERMSNCDCDCYCYCNIWCHTS